MIKSEDNFVEWTYGVFTNDVQNPKACWGPQKW
jgi:hypothetical protein